MKTSLKVFTEYPCLQNKIIMSFFSLIGFHRSELLKMVFCKKQQLSGISIERR
jgi:hypothetical protein